LIYEENNHLWFDKFCYRNTSNESRVRREKVEIEIPEGVKHLGEWGGDNAGISEKAEVKIKNDLVRGYYEKMKDYDVVLIVNPEKKGVKGYIGGNILIETALAYVLRNHTFMS